MNLETQKIRKWRARMTEGGKYGREWYYDPSKSHPIETIFSRMTCLLGDHDAHQGEIKKRYKFQENI
jgi:hypothetical protein